MTSPNKTFYRKMITSIIVLIPVENEYFDAGG